MDDGVNGGDVRKRTTVPVPGKNAEAAAFLQAFEILFGISHCSVNPIHSRVDGIELF